MSDSNLRRWKRQTSLLRDAALSPGQRMKAAAELQVAAKVLFLAGMKTRGFSRTEALAVWRRGHARNP